MNTLEHIWSWCESHWQLVTIACFIALLIIGPID